MRRGKFEARAGEPTVRQNELAAAQSGGAETGAERVVPERPERRRPDWLLILVPVLVVLAVAAIVVFGVIQDREEAAANIGLTKEQTLEAFQHAAEILEHEDMVLTLIPDPAAQS